METKEKNTKQLQNWSEMPEEERKRIIQETQKNWDKLPRFVIRPSQLRAER